MSAEYKRKRTSRKPLVIGGVTWTSYQTGINAYTLYSPCEHACVWRNYWRTTYSASVNGETVGHRFHTEKAACEAAAKKLSECKD